MSEGVEEVVAQEDSAHSSIKTSNKSIVRTEGLPLTARAPSESSSSDRPTDALHHINTHRHIQTWT